MERNGGRPVNGGKFSESELGRCAARVFVGEPAAGNEDASTGGELTTSHLQPECAPDVLGNVRRMVRHFATIPHDDNEGLKDVRILLRHIPLDVEFRIRVERSR
jgi:hypothetical protein